MRRILGDFDVGDVRFQYYEGGELLAVHQVDSIDETCGR